MSTLKHIQETFVSDLFGDISTALTAEIKPSQLNAAEHFRVYQNSALLMLTESLRSTFPAINTLVDEKFFNYAAAEYIKQNLPQTADLFTYGKSFIDFLATFPAAKNHPYLADVARLEWARQEAYHAANASPLNPEKFAEAAATALDTLQLTLHPSARLIQSKFPLKDLWELTLNKDQHNTVNLNEGPCSLLIIRPHLDVMMLTLSDAEFHWLSALNNGTLFTEASANLGDNLQPLLERHFSLKTFTEEKQP